jgi:hypothetical protein
MQFHQHTKFDLIIHLKKPECSIQMVIRFHPVRRDQLQFSQLILARFDLQKTLAVRALNSTEDLRYFC